jgi:hypothetical protein
MRILRRASPGWFCIIKWQARGRNLAKAGLSGNGRTHLAGLVLAARL